MSCYHPRRVSQSPVGGSVVFFRKKGYREFAIPCGWCVGCMMLESLSWKTRILHEAQLFAPYNLFVTLTYADEKLPKSLGLEYPHFQEFMRSLRSKVSGVLPIEVRRNRKGVVTEGLEKPLRFFVCGEYGGKTGRPHWHAVLFNCRFPDQRKLYCSELYQSDLLEELWPYGRVELSDLCPERAAYVAGYVTKKARQRSVSLVRWLKTRSSPELPRPRTEDVVNRQTGEVYERVREFRKMSRNPGIGALWHERYGGGLFPKDFCVIGGSRTKVPRYYTGKVSDPAQVEAIKAERRRRAREVPIVELSESRLAVKEEAALLRLEKHSRGL